MYTQGIFPPLQRAIHARTTLNERGLSMEINNSHLIQAWSSAYVASFATGNRRRVRGPLFMVYEAKDDQGDSPQQS
jgi:hypothetical protein